MQMCHSRARLSSEVSGVKLTVTAARGFRRSLYGQLQAPLRSGMIAEESDVYQRLREGSPNPIYVDARGLSVGRSSRISTQSCLLHITLSYEHTNNTDLCRHVKSAAEQLPIQQDQQCSRYSWFRVFRTNTVEQWTTDTRHCWGSVG